MLARVGRADRERALALCRALPTRPTQIAAWIHDGGLDTRSRAGALFMDDAGGLAFISELGVVMPHLSNNRSLDALARWVRPLGARVVVGPTPSAGALWKRLEASGLRARIARDQIAYGVSRSMLKSRIPAHQLSLRLARADDLEAIVSASAAMAIEESKDDPYGRNPKLFRARIADRLRRRRDFVLFENDRLVFKANVAALSPHGGHIEGVYTSPDARGRGLGLACTAWVTQWILERAPVATLLVNQDNGPARRIYERLGFVSLYASRTILAA